MSGANKSGFDTYPHETMQSALLKKPLCRGFRSNKGLFAAMHESLVGTNRTYRVRNVMSAFGVPAQPVDATLALNLSAGVSNCKVSRGRSFS
jgi:hypothetical protein